jgi:hypothetical protein
MTCLKPEILPKRRLCETNEATSLQKWILCGENPWQTMSSEMNNCQIHASLHRLFELFSETSHKNDSRQIAPFVPAAFVSLVLG